MTNIAIIGAGASGLFLTRLLSRRKDCRVTVFEKAEKVGSKIKASGGGKANLLHDGITPECYNHPEFMRRILAQCDDRRIRQLWESFGMLLRTDEEGRIYPWSEFSQTVLDTLLDNLPENVSILCGTEVFKLQPESRKWRVNDGPALFDRVVMCSGSPAGMIARKRLGYNRYIETIPMPMTPLAPSLVGFKIRNCPRKLEGCRVKAEVRMMQGERGLFRETGEITFKADGLSGIVILNASAIYNRLGQPQDCHLLLDFMYGQPRWSLREHLKQHRDLCGVLHPKLNALYRRQPFDPKRFRLDIEGTYGWEGAQVCHGGIAISCVDENLAVKGFPGLYAAGELIDIDGVCGGYNLFFACACADIIARNIS